MRFFSRICDRFNQWIDRRIASVVDRRLDYAHLGETVDIKQLAASMDMYAVCCELIDHIDMKDIVTDKMRNTVIDRVTTHYMTEHANSEIHEEVVQNVCDNVSVDEDELVRELVDQYDGWDVVHENICSEMAERLTEHPSDTFYAHLGRAIVTLAGK
jgi:hypothetical protein